MMLFSSNNDYKVIVSHLLKKIKSLRLLREIDFEIVYANITGMLKIRLQRVGRKNDPSFRVVLTDSKNATRSNKFKEILGSYDARHGEPVIKGDRVTYWMSVGAKPSGTVHNLLVAGKIISGKKINVLSKKSPIRKETPATA